MKKALALILALMMLMSIIPMTSFAATVTTTDSTAFTVAQVATAAATLKKSIDTNKKVPTTIKIGTYVTATSTFLRMMAATICNIYDGSTSTKVYSKAMAAPSSSNDNTTAGSMTKANYIALAASIYSYMTTNKKAPASLKANSNGTFGYYNLVYSMAKLMDYYKTNGKLSGSLTVKTWATISATPKPTVAPTTTAPTTAPMVAPTTAPTVAPTTSVTTTNSTYFTVAQVGTAATTLRNSIEKNKKVPTTVKIGTYVTATSTFLRMMVATICNIYDGSTSTKVYSKAMAAPSKSTDSATSGNMTKANYIALAASLYDYMGTNAKAPVSMKGKTNGTLGYYNLVYSFAKIMAFYKANSYLPNYCSIQPWSKIAPAVTTAPATAKPTTAATQAPATTTAPATAKPTTAPVTGKYTLAQLLAKAAPNKEWITTNKSLPNYTTIDNVQIKMPDYLYMICQATVDLVNGVTTNKYDTVNAKAPTASSESISGTHNIYTADYADMASRIVEQMKSNSYTVPNYCTYKDTTKVGYESLIFMYSKILAYYKTNGVLPNYCAVSKFASTSSSSSSSSSTSTSTGGREACPSGYEKYLVATTNCQVNNATIKSVAKTARGSATTQYKMGFNVFNYLQNATSYWYAYSNTKLGALGTWNKRKGNCCDLGHLAVAVWRAAGVPARYYHAQITSSGGSNYGHVWAQCYLNGKWYHGDLSNSINTLRTSLPQSVAKIRYLNGTYITLPF